MATNNSADYSPTNHAVQVGAANGGLTSLALGTSGQVLTSAGSGSDPSFQTISGQSSKWVYLDKQSGGGSVTSLTFTSGISSTYNNYVFVLTGLFTGSGSEIFMQFSNDGGSTYEDTSNDGGASAFTTGETTFTPAGTTEGISVVPFSDTTGDGSGGASGYMWFMNRSGNAMVFGDVSVGLGTVTIYRSLTVGTNILPITGINAIRFTTTLQSDFITDGTITLYGLVES